MKKISGFLLMLGLLLLIGSFGISSRAYAQAVPTTTVISTDSLGVETYLVQFPDGRPDQTAVGVDELSRIMTAYAAEVSNSLTSTISNSGNGSGSSYIGGLWQGVVDTVDDEIQNILQEGVQDIMNGIKDTIISYITSLLDSTPITEVSSMKRLLKDAYSKQQKVQYQDYKVKYAEMKSQTELSSGFVKYYNALDLKKQIELFANQVENTRKLAGTRFFSSSQQAASKDVLNKIGNTDALVEDVKTACNLNQGTVYMTEADRVKVLESARDEIKVRQNQLSALNKFLSGVYASRVTAYSKQQQLRGMYGSNSTLNRNAEAGDVKLNQ